MTFTRDFEQDLTNFLCCPSCSNDELKIAQDGLVICSVCGSEYTYDEANKFASLLAPDSTTEIKEDIQKWWGDLYKQAYEGHEDGIGPEAMEERLIDLADMFEKRELLPAVEMPAGNLDGLKILEIGSGAGAHSALFKHRGASVTSVDITPERVMATARKFSLVQNGSGRAYHADAENLPFRDGVFDIVYSNGVLHHSEDTQKCISEVHRVLKSGGKAVIMLYSRHSAIYWLNVLPRALITGEFFRWPEAQWIGRLTEGRPKFGTTKNPITRVYSASEITKTFHAFKTLSLRKNSFQFDNFCVPKLTQIRSYLMNLFGVKPHLGGLMIYGFPYFVETNLELKLGRYAGFAWNIIAKK